MIKYKKTFKNFNFKNLFKLPLLISLFISCGLTGETKIRLERSAKDITDAINEIKKKAAASGVKFENFREKQTGSQVSEKPEFILKAKMQATDVAEKFVTAIEEEATKLKETGSSGEFSAMYNLMLEVSAPLEEIGIQDMKKTVTGTAEENSTTTAEGILEIAKAMKTKLQKVHKKNKCALERKTNTNNTSNDCSKTN
ncbi:decorin-binding protein DbpA (plasmid) [Borreliella californiensis]|uniref:Decorin-binding protein DbpA n=1 Tax=Borreliella californiensis TaxID=373543 RepID=A0A7W9ZLL4_9SPIR|nr:decorin-binding protein DbpA [Borreliella californiensis]MBB6213380.1 hypothetical protein [Borreliella californiensis]MBB6213461.1 hypothetical protein [Borreliella californiensis]WKC91286.1 decorin-binding protein DbpA [Borreliella californiensis]WNY70945.1 decorin-binding protein DbpA [Borreliella californiensis]